MDVPYRRGVPIPPGERSAMPHIGPIEEPPEGSGLMVVDMGPSHPAMHGTIKMRVLLDGETIEAVDVEPGYLHRGFEKSCEAVTWTQVFPYTDRLNYVSPLINNHCFAAAVEKLFDIEIPERAKVLRTLSAELSRMSDHCTCVGASTMELGAFTGMLYLIEARDILWDAVEELTGARLTVSYTRIGGVVSDLPEGYADSLRKRLDRVVELMDDVETLLNDNQIFLQRTKGVGCINGRDALDWGWTGPCLRSTGVAYDVRRAAPYDAYGRLEFDVPVGQNGDNYDRYLVRMEELRQSRRIVLQCLDILDDTPPEIISPDPRIAMPDKDKVHTAIEELMNHFKLVIDGIQVPEGEAYAYQEGANGELGFYLVSDGGGKPWKIRCRPPCFPVTSSMPMIVQGAMIADVVPTFGSLNMIGGECDR
ncbi:MAG TPA: NADH-quinone oxidoreductase subunit D [Myxococcales bacterium LLY-WYZ-16_1]|jgi:NADH-quinone oxidoreductase subunit D|nr:NADH-quinone oxidoreductase subunit D [Myxococcales bacterium LLY-WYZ-16_1]